MLSDYKQLSDKTVWSSYGYGMAETNVLVPRTCASVFILTGILDCAFAVAIEIASVKTV
jgi:hypothetical protein